jgi:hypothetical protein
LLAFFRYNPLVVVPVQVIHGLLVPAPESFTVVSTFAIRHMRMLVLIAVLYIRPAMIIKIFAGAFNAVVETLSLNFTKFIGRHIPPTVLLRSGSSSAISNAACFGLTRGDYHQRHRKH